MEAFRDLQHGNLRYLNGEEDRSPSHHGPLDDESALISTPLMRLCSMNEPQPMVVTTNSQPSERSEGWCQRAYVTGFLRTPTSTKDASRFMSGLADRLRDEGTVEFGLYRMNTPSPEWREHIDAQDPPIDSSHRPVPNYLQGVSFQRRDGHEWTMFTNGNDRENPFKNWKEARWEVGQYNTAEYAPSEDPRVIAFFVCDARFDFPEAERCVTVLKATLR